MTVLLFAEIRNLLDGRATRAALAAVQALGPVDLLVCGTAETASVVTAWPGLATVLHCADPACAQGLAEPLAALLAALAQSYIHLVAPATAQGANVMPRLAALLDLQPIPNVVGILDAQTFTRPTHAGNALVTLRSDQARQVLTINPLAFEPVPPQGGAAALRAVVAPPGTGPSAWLSFTPPAASARPDLATARVVVAGGRGLGGTEAVPALEALADCLGAAVGASLAAVEAGYLPSELQVGQSGLAVAPELYIAAGISGAIQHLAGMQGAKVVVAINLDPDAPIHAAADYSLVGDLTELLPALTTALG
jgi:electron transfer flavoprotein alpha subunit